MSKLSNSTDLRQDKHGTSKLDLRSSINEFTDVPLLKKQVMTQKGMGMCLPDPDSNKKAPQQNLSRREVVRISIADKNQYTPSPDMTSANEQSSDVKTEISSRELQEVDYMERMATGQLRRPESPQTKTLGKYVEMDKNGWVGQTDLLSTITPSDQQLNRFLKDKNKFVAGQRKSRKLRARNFATTQIKFTKNTEETMGSPNAFKAQKAVMKLKKMEKHDLAAYSIAINSDREMKRSVLVPMAPPY